LSNTLNWS